MKRMFFVVVSGLIAVGPAARTEQMRETVAATGRVPPEAITPDVETKLLEQFRGWKRRGAPPGG